ncbi:peptidylprolyl isomerase [Oceanimonas baumannii]|uniref:Peptidyl-prolyl cis-trans isomerase n=1 Tax=Oceanimonas baumannii TaxID=129578 RepID=A0A235CPJ9_9GAMM|nr:peptidylprolyl isomerase [Oceanimonas baumannii]MCC4265027.1 peptidylprolyl isomerase [Oceanimonas baumannii]OYD26359.1 peptidylprolyl isomerase [Oceanimonas baumannii]TDW61981.1 peptidyl-prolyl cis-trans isomerase A (cyclophilin A) [Oceanimonas baumannii]
MKNVLLLLAGLLSATSALAGPKVELVTSLGNLEIELNEEAAPKTVANFLRYVDDGSYKGTLFHRLIPGFVVQGGGFDSDYERLPTYDPVQNESGNGLSNAAGTIAMARTQDPHSATRQFYINLGNNTSLDGGRRAGYTVFGKVVKGEEVLERMSLVPTGMSLQLRARDVPETPIILEQVRRLPED